MTTPRELIIEALKKGPATLSELADMLPVLDRDTVRDAARHASEAGLVSKRIDESNQPLYTLTPEGKAWVPHQGGKGKKRDKPATVAAQAPSDLMNTIIKFCNWVDTEFSTGKRYPINLEECQHILFTWRDDLLDDLESSRAQARQYIASDEACGQIHRVCHDAGIPEGFVVDRVEGLAARIAMLEANASLPFESAPAAPVATVKYSLTAQPGHFVETTADMVNHPAHYQGKVECIDAIESALGPEGFAAYCRGNALKYTFRAGKKGPAALDLAKAVWYIERIAS